MGKNDSRDAAIKARLQASRLVTHHEKPSEKVPRKELADLKRTRAEDEKVEKKEEPGKIQDHLARVVSVLREVAGFSFKEIDTILKIPRGEAKRTVSKDAHGYEVWTQRHIDACISRFYRNKITILEHLIQSAPASIRMWSRIVDDAEESRTAKTTAAKEIREWTALFLRTKQSGAVRDLFSKDLKERADEADEMEQMLQDMLGSALDGATEN